MEFGYASKIGFALMGINGVESSLELRKLGEFRSSFIGIIQGVYAHY